MPGYNPRREIDTDILYNLRTCNQRVEIVSTALEDLKDADRVAKAASGDAYQPDPDLRAALVEAETVLDYLNSQQIIHIRRAAEHIKALNGVEVFDAPPPPHRPANNRSSLPTRQDGYRPPPRSPAGYQPVRRLDKPVKEEAPEALPGW